MESCLSIDQISITKKTDFDIIGFYLSTGVLLKCFRAFTLQENKNKLRLRKFFFY